MRLGGEEVDKKEIGHLLDEIGLFLELKGENPFKSKAYYNGARTIEFLEEDLAVLVQENRLAKLKGIGKTLADNITELVLTGKLEYYEELKASVPPGLLEMLRIPGLGPKKIKVIYEKLGIATIGELEYACQENRLIDLSGFGKKSQEKVLQGIEYLKRYQGKFLFPVAWEEAVALGEQLSDHPQVSRWSVGGSLRRKKEIVKDIDLLVGTSDPLEVGAFLVSLPKVEKVISQGDSKISLQLDSGINVDVLLMEDNLFPYALHHFTGSKEHNAAMRHRAKEKGIKINEYGLFKENKLLVCHNEKDFFQKLELNFIPPELREDLGEIQAAEKGNLPNLIEQKDLCGVFHVHTTYSDGIATLQEIGDTARQMGLSYVGIADHSQSAVYAKGLKIGDIERQHEEIDFLNQRFTDFKFFKGVEADILADGNLDYPDEILARFDFVIASVHSRFNMSKKEMTERIQKAMDNPYVTMLGHPTGRILLAREPYQVDMEALLQKALEKGIIMELNASPYRLDLDWINCKKAKSKGIKVSINPDAHKREHLQQIIYGVNIARKGWLEAEDVINTLSLQEIEKFLKKRYP